MTTEHSTYTYEGGEQETVTLRRGPATPSGRALLQIAYSGGGASDCYVDLAWLRDRLNDLDPRPLTPDAITDEMVLLFMNTYDRLSDGSKDAPSLNHFTAARTSLTRSALTAALTEPPARPEGAEELDPIVDEFLTSYWRGDIDGADATDWLAERGVRVVTEEDPR